VIFGHDLPEHGADVADVRRQAAAAGRDPRKVLTYNLVTVIVGETDAKAQAKFAEYQQYASYDGALVFMSGWSGIDFGQYAPTDLVRKVETNAIVSVVENLAGGSKSWTIEELARWGGIGGLGPVFVGSPSTIADILQGWVEETDVDGFNLAYAVTPETFEDVVNLLVPELQKRGVYPKAYRPGTRGLNVDVRADPATSRRLPVVQGYPGAQRAELRRGARRNLRPDRTQWRRQELAAQCHQRRIPRRFR